MTKFVFKITLLMALTMISLGCSSLFIAENKPKTVQEKSNPENVALENNTLNSIKEFESVTQGLISDISSNGKTIVLLKQDPEVEDPAMDIEGFNSIFLYDLKDQTIQHVISPHVNITLGDFDQKEDGIFYLENTSESAFHLYWIDNAGEKKLRVSSPDHKINPNYYVLPNNEVYYGTQDGKIVHANKDRILSTIDIGLDYSIRQIHYYRKENLILFTAEHNENVNLYSINSDGKELTLILSGILGSFQVNPQADQMIYLTPISDSNKSTLWLFDLEKMENKNLLEGYPRLLTFSPKGDKIAYLDRTESNNDLHNIWIMDLKTNEKIQVASNLKLISRIFWHPKENRLYFSTFERIDGERQATLHSLNFEE